jgi:D-alanyl-D-alanine carboxypeptidase (penicillin-binding protein 5/6)
MDNRASILLFFPFIVLLFGGCAQQEITSARRFSTSPIAVQPIGVSNVWPNSAPAIRARYAILIDARSGRTLFQKNADIHTPVASTQKLITALLVVEKGNLDASIPIHRADTHVEPMKLNLRAGDHYTRRALLNALLVASMNDAAEALGRDVAGSSAAIGPAMTRFARSLGAYDSRFVNATGLPAAQYSTARDMARVAWRAYHDTILRQIVCQPNYLFRYANGRARLLEATNLLVRGSSLYNGLKTGYTFASGRCLITSAARNGQAFILVQLGSETRYIFRDAENVIAWAFEE